MLWAKDLPVFTRPINGGCRPPRNRKYDPFLEPDSKSPDEELISDDHQRREITFVAQNPTFIYLFSGPGAAFE